MNESALAEADDQLPVDQRSDYLASVRFGGVFRTDNHTLAWWRLAPSTGLYHAVSQAGHAEGPTLCRRRVALVSLATKGWIWGEDPSRSIMTCLDCAEQVFRVRPTTAKTAP